MINRLTTLAAALLLALSLAPAASASPAKPGPTAPFGLPNFADPPTRIGSCHPVGIVATLPTGQAVTLNAHDCTPRGQHPHTVLILVHGATYDSAYWSWPQDPARYSFAWAALRAGYAVLAVDRLGQGASSRPASALDSFPAQAATLHAVATWAARHWPRRVIVGHSFGSAEEAAELAAWPRDADAAVFTGSGHTVSAATNALSHSGFAPAASLGARFATLDAGYETSTTLTVRARLLYRPADADPAVIAFDQRTRDTLSLTELTTRPPNLSGLTRSLAMPTLLIDGQNDAHYCDGAQQPAETNLDDCATGASLYASERGNYGPCLATAVVPGSGHDLQTEFGAPVAARLILNWVHATVSPASRSVRCAVVGPVHTHP